MLIEKHMAVAATAIGLALAGPDALTLLQGQRHASGVGMLVGGLIGALGVFLGATVATSYVDRRVRTLRLAGWALGALVMRETGTLGYRVRRTGRIVLKRRETQVAIEGGTVRVKAADLGGMLRTGLEDTFYLPDGGKASGNGALIEALARCARNAGREIASAAEARSMLDLRPQA